jgi:hypothetical protein
MPEVPESRNERLQGWKEIAYHLGVSVRTAQTLERAEGLPIRRGASPKAPVFAYRAELIAWERRRCGPGDARRDSEPGEATPGPTCPESGPQPSKRQSTAGNLRKRLRPSALALSAAVVLVVVASGYYLVNPHGAVTDVKVTGRILTAFNERGQELWHYEHPSAFAEPGYEEHKWDWVWIGDLDGSKEIVLFAAKALDWDKVPDRLIAFDNRGQVLWDYTPGRSVTDALGTIMVPPYRLGTIEVFRARQGLDPRIVVSSYHYLEDADQVVVLDAQGRVSGEYWHPGHLLHTAQAHIDGSTQPYVLLAGVNNGNHQATLVVLDPWAIKGQATPMNLQDSRFQLQGFAPAKEKAVIFFPRSCISRGQPYTRVQRLRVTAGRIIAEVAEGPAEEIFPPLVYEFDLNLRLVHLTPGSDSFRIRHDQMYAQGELDHPFSAAEMEKLGAGLIVVR